MEWTCRWPDPLTCATRRRLAAESVLSLFTLYFQELQIRTMAWSNEALWVVSDSTGEECADLTDRVLCLRSSSGSGITTRVHQSFDGGID